MAASGAGVGGVPPAGQAWKVPPASAQPCRPLARLVPRMYRKTWSPRPELLVIVTGIVAPATAASAPGARATAAAPPPRVTAPATSGTSSLCLIRMKGSFDLVRALSHSPCDSDECQYLPEKRYGLRRIHDRGHAHLAGPDRLPPARRRRRHRVAPRPRRGAAA